MMLRSAILAMLAALSISDLASAQVQNPASYTDGQVLSAAGLNAPFATLAGEVQPATSTLTGATSGAATDRIVVLQGGVNLTETPAQIATGMGLGALAYLNTLPCADTPALTGAIISPAGSCSTTYSAFSSPQITSALGFTPANIAGQAFTGAVSAPSISAIGSVSGATISASTSLASPTITVSSTLKVVGLLASATAPTIVSGFGTSTTITATNGTAAFQVTIGSSPTSNGVIGLPTASNGWDCKATDITTTSTAVFLTKQIGGGLGSATLGNYTTAAATGPWTAGDVLNVSCFAR